MKVNALQVRQQLGKILNYLKKGEPIIILKGKKEVAVLIAIDIFKKRFIDYQEIEKRDALVKTFKENIQSTHLNSLKLLRELRYGSGH